MVRNVCSSLVLDPVRESLVCSSGAVLLCAVIRAGGLDRGLSAALSRWRADRAVHDPGRVLLDVVTAVALGGDCLADIAAVRPSRRCSDRSLRIRRCHGSFATLAADVDAVVAAVRGERARARAAVWARSRPLAGVTGPSRRAVRRSLILTPRRCGPRLR